MAYVEKWDWTKSNLDATAEETQRAYAALIGNGATKNFSYRVWNDIVSKILELRNNYGDTWDESILPFAETKMSASSPITADMFNSAVANIPVANYPWPWTEQLGRKNIQKGDICYGSYFLWVTEGFNHWDDLEKLIISLSDRFEFLGVVQPDSYNTCPMMEKGSAGKTDENLVIMVADAVFPKLDGKMAELHHTFQIAGYENALAFASTFNFFTYYTRKFDVSLYGTNRSVYNGPFSPALNHNFNSDIYGTNSQSCNPFRLILESQLTSENVAAMYREFIGGIPPIAMSGYRDVAQINTLMEKDALTLKMLSYLVKVPGVDLAQIEKFWITNRDFHIDAVRPSIPGALSDKLKTDSLVQLYHAGFVSNAHVHKIKLDEVFSIAYVYQKALLFKHGLQTAGSYEYGISSPQSLIAEYLIKQNSDVKNTVCVANYLNTVNSNYFISKVQILSREGTRLLVDSFQKMYGHGKLRQNDSLPLLFNNDTHFNIENANSVILPSQNLITENCHVMQSEQATAVQRDTALVHGVDVLIKEYQFGESVTVQATHLPDTHMFRAKTEMFGQTVQKEKQLLDVSDNILISTPETILSKRSLSHTNADLQIVQSEQVHVNSVVPKDFVVSVSTNESSSAGIESYASTKLHSSQNVIKMNHIFTLSFDSGGDVLASELEHFFASDLDEKLVINVETR